MDSGANVVFRRGAQSQGLPAFYLVNVTVSGAWVFANDFEAGPVTVVQQTVPIAGCSSCRPDAACPYSTVFHAAACTQHSSPGSKRTII